MDGTGSVCSARPTVLPEFSLLVPLALTFFVRCHRRSSFLLTHQLFEALWEEGGGSESQQVQFSSTFVDDFLWRSMRIVKIRI